MRASSVVAVIPAQDAERAAAFYEQSLGFSPSSVGPDGSRVYEAADGSHVLVYPTQFAGTGQHTVANFMVDDLAETMSELRANGVKFNEYDLGEGMSTTDGVIQYGDMQNAWFTDPEGNVVGLMQAPSDWATRDWG